MPGTLARCAASLAFPRLIGHAVGRREAWRAVGGGLRACGLDADAIRRRVARGWLHRVYAVGHPALTPEGRWLAAVKAVHRTRTLPPEDIWRHEGIPVTTGERALIDVATTRTDMQVRKAMATARSKHLTNLRRLAGGFEPPDVNKPIHLQGRRIIPDLRCPEQRLIAAADGARWHEDPQARALDAERQALLEAHGERLLRVAWPQATAGASQTLARTARRAPRGPSARP